MNLSQIVLLTQNEILERLTRLARSYFVFAAGLIILSNEFASLYNNPDANVAVASCLAIIQYCAENDPQAQRVLYILETFKEVVRSRASTAVPVVSFPNRRIPIITPASSNPQHDPMAHFFRHTKYSPEVQQLPILAPTIKHERLSISASYQNPTPSSIHQQPSPEDAADASPVGAVTMSASDSIPSQDIAFNLDDLWPPTWHPPNGIMQIGQHVQPGEAYNQYTLGPPSSGPGTMAPNNTTVSFYPTSEYQ